MTAETQPRAPALQLLPLGLAIVGAVAPCLAATT